MNKDDIMKVIDGVVYYHYDYTDYLYNIINKAIEYIELVKDFNKEYEKDWEFDIFIPHLLDILKGSDTNGND